MRERTGSSETARSEDRGTGDDARDAAFARLGRQARRFPDLDLRPLDTEALSARDAAFAHAIDDGVVRRWLTLEHLIQGFLDKRFEKLDAKVRAALLGGAAQILLLDRVPVHAAINHAVEWTKRRLHRGAGGLVNAVLRRVAGLVVPDQRRERWSGGRDEIPLADGTARVLRRPVLPEDRLDLLAAATSHPRALLEAWRSQHGEERVGRLALHSLISPPVILNTSHTESGAFEHEAVTEHDVDGHCVFAGTRRELVSLLERRRDVWVQDPGSAMAVLRARDLSPGLIVDACAGQGTKTRQLAAVFPRARIIASDADDDRVETLRAVFRGHPRVEVVVAGKLREAAAGSADLVLVDVPCSNTGVLARRPEAKYRFDDAHVESLVGVQRQIVADSMLLRRASGRPGVLLYSTCSLDGRENRGIADWACRWHRLTVRGEVSHFPTGLPGDSACSYTDGSYSTLLA